MRGQRCIEDFDPRVDYFPDKAVFEHATQVAVEYRGHYKLVRLAQPWPGAERGVRYGLLQCGAPRPDGHDDVTWIEVPARSVVTTSTTELPHLVALDLVDRLIGHDEFDYVSSPEIRRRIERGAVTEVGSGAALNLELVVALAPDLLLVDSFGEPEFDTHGKLRELGVPVAMVPSFLETTPLGRAEWIKYTALFFNRERRAAESFAAVAERYEALASRVRAAVADDARPAVLTGAPTGEVWYVPGGASFLARLLRDAGARLPWPEDEATGSRTLALEAVYERALEVDYWLHPSALETLAEIRAVDPRFAELPVVQAGAVYGNDRRVSAAGGNAYWEAGAARPDLVLADLVAIFHPALAEGHELVFHRQLNEGIAR